MRLKHFDYRYWSDAYWWPPSRCNLYIRRSKSLTWDNGPRLIDMVTETKIKDANKIVIHAENQTVSVIRGLDFEIKRLMIRQKARNKGEKWRVDCECSQNQQVQSLV